LTSCRRSVKVAVADFEWLSGPDTIGKEQVKARMSTSGKRALGLVLICAAVLGTGCGGSGSHASGTNGAATGAAYTATPMTTASLIATADAICRGLNQSLGSGVFTSLKQIGRIVPRRVQLEEAALLKLERLNPPSANASDWRQMMESRRALIVDTREIGQAAHAHNPDAVRSLLVSAGDVARRLMQAARRVGFSDCATVD
jgi:hypothetical protein